MARDHTQTLFSMWTDEDFCTNYLVDKLLYNVLIGQPAMNWAGVQPINWKRWRKAMRDGDTMPSELDLMASLIRLERRRYIFTDDDLGEVLARTRMRVGKVDAQPKVLLSALRNIAVVESPKIAAVLVEELGLLTLPTINADSKSAKTLQADLKQAWDAARTHCETLSEGLTKPFPEPFAEEFPEGLPEGFARPAETVFTPKPFPKGFPKGMEVEVEVGVDLSSGDTHLPEKNTPKPPNDETLTAELVPLRSNGVEQARARFAAIPVQASAHARRIAQAYSDSLPAPIEARLLGKIAIEIDACLRSEIHPDAIAAGLRAWGESGAFSPTQIPNYVHKAAAARAKTVSGVGKPTEKALGIRSAGEELIAEMTRE